MQRGVVHYSHTVHYSNKNKHDFCRGEDPTKNFCAELRNHSIKITNCEKKWILPLTEKEETKLSHIFKERLNDILNENEN